MLALSPSWHRTGRRFAGALLWVALLGGVFAMHGLSTHGVTGSVGAPLASTDHTAGASHDAMPAGHPAPDGDHAGMAMLCLAILVTAIFMAWITGFRAQRLIFTAKRPRHLPRSGTPHPPPVAHFSVMRC